MPRLSCCINTCKGKGAVKDPTVTLIPFPKDANLADEWRGVCGLPGDFVVKATTRICSKHFRTGKRSLNPDSEDYIPSVFEAAFPITNRSYCHTCRKVTTTCPCKVIAAIQQSGIDDEEDGESVDDNLNGGEVDGDGDDGGGADNNGDQDEEDEEGDMEESEPEDVLDDGQVLDTDDDDWTPDVKTDLDKPRRSSRSRKKRRHASSSESSSDEVEKDESPPPKLVKMALLPVTEKSVSPGKKGKWATPAELKQQEPSSISMVTPIPKKRGGRRPKSQTTTPAENENETPGTDSNANSTPQTGIATPNNKSTPNKTVVLPQQDDKWSAKMKEMEIEHSMKLEKIQKNHNMRFANLKEEHVQTIHRMKIEWELEKANLLSQIEYYKETMNHRTDEEPMNPFNGGQPIIVLPAPDHDED